MYTFDTYRCVYCHQLYIPNGQLGHDCPERQAHLTAVEIARQGSEYFERAPKTAAYYGEKAKSERL